MLDDRILRAAKDPLYRELKVMLGRWHSIKIGVLPMTDDKNKQQGQGGQQSGQQGGQGGRQDQQGGQGGRQAQQSQQDKDKKQGGQQDQQKH